MIFSVPLCLCGSNRRREPGRNEPGYHHLIEPQRHRDTENQHRENGQAMVEFVFILIIVMGCCAGMLAITRLLTFQFWAQQESRFLAFEKVWSAEEFYTDNSIDPASLLESGTDIGRPGIVTAREHTRTTEDDGTPSELIAWLFSSPEEELGLNAPIREREDSHSILLARTSPSEMFSWVGTASARQDDGGRTDIDADSIQEREEGYSDSRPRPTVYQEKIGRGFENVLEREGFGPKFCSAMVRHFREGGDAALASQFAERDCAKKANTEFGMHLGENLDFKEFFQDFGDRIQWGDAPHEAMDGTIRTAIANQFYSFFDTLVSGARALSPALIVANAAQADLALIDSATTRLLTDARYIGSTVAVGAVIAAAAPLSLPSHQTGTDSDALLETENNFIVDILHVDADEVIPGGVAFFLSPLYLPVPPTFGAAGPAFQDAAMKNAFFEDSSLIDRFVENSNKKVKINYKASGGLFPAATRRFAGINNVQLTSNNYIIAQPWHITRRISSNGDYRQKGTETDEIDDNTEEGVLRRRVSGLWLFPSNIVTFLEPITALPGLGALAPVLNALEPLGSVLGFVKSFVLVDNPIFKILDMLADLPGIGAIIPTVPKWPAVRPDAYVGSEEMTGNSMSDPDKLMGSDREFQDYIDEQEEFNPEPNPEFN